MTVETEATIAAAYRQFKSAKESARLIAEEAASETFRKVLDDTLRRDQDEFSKRLQIAHAQGMTKSDLRTATRQYNNPGFKALFDAYQPAPGEFDRYDPAKVAAQEQAQAAAFTFVREIHSDEGLDFVVVENGAGDTYDVNVMIPASIDAYNRDIPIAAVDAAKEYLDTRDTTD